MRARRRFFQRVRRRSERSNDVRTDKFARARMGALAGKATLTFVPEGELSAIGTLQGTASIASASKQDQRRKGGRNKRGHRAAENLWPRFKKVYAKLSRGGQRRVSRWQNGAMVLRWAASALLNAEKKFRRVTGHSELWMLENALKTLLIEHQPVAELANETKAA